MTNKRLKMHDRPLGKIIDNAITYSFGSIWKHVRLCHLFSLFSAALWAFLIEEKSEITFIYLMEIMWVQKRISLFYFLTLNCHLGHFCTELLFYYIIMLFLTKTSIILLLSKKCSKNGDTYSCWPCNIVLNIAIIQFSELYIYKPEKQVVP